MASLLIDYTNLLHEKKSLTDSAVMQFKQDHKNDKEFVQQAEVVDWAFRARNVAKVHENAVASTHELEPA
jgi:hypothetical protein